MLLQYWGSNVLFGSRTKENEVSKVSSTLGMTMASLYLSSGLPTGQTMTPHITIEKKTTLL